MIKKAFREILERSGLRIKRLKYLPWGEDLFVDLQKLLTLEKVTTVFDVGANVGQSCTNYLKKFNQAHIHSFEPILTTFQSLQKKFHSISRVTTIHAALGSKPEKIIVHIQKSSTLNSLNEHRNLPTTQSNQEIVTVITLDQYCLDNSIDQIDFLKIDTEGFEREVLSGAQKKLAEGKIKLILLELGIKKNMQTSFYNDIHALLTSLGYETLGFYRQSQSLYSKDRFVMHCDVLFINQNWSKTLSPSFVKVCTES